MVATHQESLDDLLPDSSGLTGDDMDALLDEVTQPVTQPAVMPRQNGKNASAKAGAVPLKRTPAQIKAAEKRAVEAQAAADLRVQEDAAKARAAQLAQIVNLHIAGYSLTDIGVSIGATADEVDRLLASETQRYVRSQPALRTYVRNWISEKYTKMIEADWDEATDKTHPEKLDNQDRVMRMLDKMGRLHGADAPIQSEVKVDAAPEAVERLVGALAAASGMGYDVNVFDVVADVVDGEVVEDAVTESHKALESASHEVEQPQEGDEDGF